MEYLDSARIKVTHFSEACKCWKYPYNGDSPTVDILSQVQGDSSTEDSVASTPVVTPAIEIKPFPGDVTPTAENQSGFVDESKPKSHDTEKSEESASANASADSSGSADASAESSNGTKQASSSVSDEGKSSEDNISKLPVITDSQKSSHTKQDSCADSVISEADSALSASSSNTETAPNGGDQPGSRSDSPLNDDFGSQDFNAFLLSLKRVKTPVEFCDNMEDSIQEFEELINELKVNISSRTSTSGTSNQAESQELPKFVNSTDTKEVIKPAVTKPAQSEHAKPEVSELTEFDKEITRSTREDSVLSERSLSVPGGQTFTPKSPGASATPIRYSVGAPNIGWSHIFITFYFCTLYGLL